MAREARKISKSGNYYVELKGEKLFMSDDDKEVFAKLLEKNFADGIVREYSFDTKQIRFVVKEGERGISMSMKSIATSYARYFNRTYNREGKLFEGRFKSVPLETDEDIEKYIAALKKGLSPKSDRTRKKSAPKSTQARDTKTQKAEKKPEKINKKKETSITKQLEKSGKGRGNNLPSWLL